MRRFLTAYHGSSAMLSRALAHMHATGAEPQEAAKRFLATEPEVWRSWLDPEAGKNALVTTGGFAVAGLMEEEVLPRQGEEN